MSPSVPHSLSEIESSNDGLDASGLTYGIAFVIGLIFLLATIAFACMRLRMSQTPNILNIVAGVPPPQIVERYIPEAREQGHHVNVQIDRSYERYPKMPYSEELKNKGGSTILSVCTICLGDYKERDMLRVLPDCGHIFHQACVDPWLMLHSTCPICRKSSVQAPQPSAFNDGE